MIGQRGFRFRDALFYVALTLPSRTYELMPIAALIGTIYALSKLAANSEFTIMRVSGMSTRRLMNSLIGIGLIFVVLTYVLGEFVSPPAEQLAQRARLQATGSPITVREFRSGVWVRDVVKQPGAGGVAAFRFINVRHVAPDATTKDWRIFEFDPDYKLRSIMTAETGQYDPGTGWTLYNVVETRLPGPIAGATVPQIKAARTEVVKSEQVAWPSELKPDIFGVMIVQPERMAGWDLAQYIQHLADNRQQTERYEIAFWSKLLLPLGGRRDDGARVALRIPARTLGRRQLQDLCRRDDRCRVLRT